MHGRARGPGPHPWADVRPDQPTPSPRDVVEHLLSELTRGVDALRRPIDAIKHQAKTVTVGISRELSAQRPEPGVLVLALEAAGVKAAQIADQDAAALAALEPAVDGALGVVHYELRGLDPLGAPTNDSRIVVKKKTGVAAGMDSRADRGASLTGTKRAIVRAPRVWVGMGQRDGQPLVVVPVYKNGLVTGLGLLHVTWKKEVGTRERVRALRAAGRYEDLKCAVTECDVSLERRAPRRAPAPRAAHGVDRARGADPHRPRAGGRAGPPVGALLSRSDLEDPA